MNEETGLQNAAFEIVTAESFSNSSSNSHLGTQNDSLLEQSPANEEHQKDDSDSADEFYFESDHLCLKTNKDYRRLLKHLFIVESIRAQAIRNREKLVEQMNVALADPIKFVERLQNGEDMDFPKRQHIPPIPVVDWSKYAISEDTASFARRQNTRLSARVNADANKATLGQGNEESKTLKSSQPWTAEEQKKLEDLLIKFPHEKIETRRWEKIANVLGNRTPTQVASRVQKYFIKLMKAGISVPGRMPSVSHLRKPKRHVIRQQPSTFLISQTPQVYMLDSDDDISSNYGMSLSGSNDNSCDLKMDFSDEDDVSSELRDTAEYKELMLLKKSLRERLNSPGTSQDTRFKDDSNLSSQNFFHERFNSEELGQHFGFKCSRCECEPIVGVRWRCTQCSSIDLCDNCVNCLFEIGSHTSDHQLEAIHKVKSIFVDRNYKFSGKNYNYLDPNYMPAI